MTTPRLVMLSVIFILCAVIVGVPFLAGAEVTAFTVNDDPKIEADGTFMIRQAHLWLPDETRGPLIQNWGRRDFRVGWVGYRCISGYTWVAVSHQGQTYYTSREYVAKGLLPEPSKCEEPPSGGHIYGQVLVLSIGFLLYLAYRFG